MNICLVLLWLLSSFTVMEAKKDYYEVLGVKRTATDRQIKKAFHKMSLKYHPDKNKDPRAEKQFSRISQAYNVLSNPEQRALYDEQGDSAFENEDGTPSAGGPKQQPQANPFGGGNPFSGFGGNPFGGGGGGGFPGFSFNFGSGGSGNPFGGGGAGRGFPGAGGGFPGQRPMGGKTARAQPTPSPSPEPKEVDRVVQLKKASWPFGKQESSKTRRQCWLVFFTTGDSASADLKTEMTKAANKLKGVVHFGEYKVIAKADVLFAKNFGATTLPATKWFGYGKEHDAPIDYTGKPKSAEIVAFAKNKLPSFVMLELETVEAVEEWQTTLAGTPWLLSVSERTEPLPVMHTLSRLYKGALAVGHLRYDKANKALSTDRLAKLGWQASRLKDIKNSLLLRDGKKRWEYKGEMTSEAIRKWVATFLKKRKAGEVMEGAMEVHTEL
eukprot:g62316.t1